MDVRVLEVNTNDELEVGVDYPSDLRLSHPAARRAAR